ncbi:MAG: hypothetical protein JGK17_22550 [Microcoleus sp. PH2017_10_PVI_O_A]|uniref:hypothetical protein n=1 Tax=unclassified Microcoleus TaxID=2642155 RepID=UPI001D5994DF|nr:MULTISPECIES: hypothetical protein [unclassified Microcoleus]MCC3408317.1 hypothetical protein [Microcoleus sp. PH2017_10_PVI_O_A]MCC3461611.1 hypothetical protein [Microcoleus sp. PH2017_11_PCY_U_A]MCC3480878.1 hypothetical protein [Microcoleus sp. PH2017_12_PCY_D_A]MCC3530785.1 hypothetical protein [Microcoleus sp. PH2017_21_RUC_O_A]MCC3543171.1 hypothetical protein [Microcoleus sp. PH2017_22_RUC_O_B]
MITRIDKTTSIAIAQITQIYHCGSSIAIAQAFKIQFKIGIGCKFYVNGFYEKPD